MTDQPKPKLPEYETNVSGRFVYFRERQGITQAETARIMGLSRDQVASLENGRVALRAIPALRFCKEFNLSPRWLATGLQPMWGWVDLPPALLGSIEPRAALSTAYAMFLSEHLEQIADDLGRRLCASDEDVPVGASPGWRRTLTRYLAAHMNLIPQRLAQAYIDSVANASAEFLFKNLGALSALKSSAQKRKDRGDTKPTHRKASVSAEGK
jgi:DNA-binding XRE family transcriptional regulator